jgi:hypothetical protein
VVVFLPDVIVSAIITFIGHLDSPSGREGSNGDDACVSQSNDHGAELIRPAWFELRCLVQRTAKRNVVRHGTLRMVYPGSKGRISH